MLIGANIIFAGVGIVLSCAVTNARRYIKGETEYSPLWQLGVGICLLGIAVALVELEFV